jgi:hypothetical protein
MEFPSPAPIHESPMSDIRDDTRTGFTDIFG